MNRRFWTVGIRIACARQVCETASALLNPTDQCTPPRTIAWPIFACLDYNHLDVESSLDSMVDPFTHCETTLSCFQVVKHFAPQHFPARAGVVTC
jgi:hypothetical protein